MGNALFASMCLFSDYAGNNVIVLAILGKGLNVRSHIYILQTTTAVKVGVLTFSQ